MNDNNKPKTHENSKNKQQNSNRPVNALNNSFELEKNSLDHERKPAEIGFNMKR